MEEDFKSRGDVCPQLLDLIPKENEWISGDSIGGGEKDLKASEEKDLELSLGLPGGQRGGGRRREDKGEDSSVLSLGLFSKSVTTNLSVGAKRGFLDTVEHEREVSHHQKQGGFVQLQSRAGLGKELSQKASGINGKAEQLQSHERKASHAACEAGSSTRSQTKTTSVPVVGWPPIRSFRKNLASNSLKPSVESANEQLESREMKPEKCKKGLFVKINMDGIPIGRKIDLKAYDNYKKLSEAVEGLFKDLLAAQKDPSSNYAQNEDEELFSGILNGTGKYILVYEDSEGDRMLVGDVPWEMFISTAKRLRVLKTSDLPKLHLGAESRKKTSTLLR